METEYCALAGTDCRPLLLRRRASRPQLKRDPLGRSVYAPMVRTLVVAFALGSVLSTPAQAQLSDALARPFPRRWEFGAWVGGGPSVVTASLGGVPNRALFLTTVSVTRALITVKRFACSYFAEVMPFVIATRVPKTEGSWFYNASHTDSTYFVVPAGAGPVLGTGIVPFGLRLSASLGSSLLGYTEASGGVVAFSRAVPSAEARRMNFLGGVGAGVRFGSGGDRRYSLGYRFLHLSNANTARENPGFNAHVFYVGIMLR